MHGQLVCFHHGGAAPQNRAAAQRRLTEQQVARELAELADVPSMRSAQDLYTELMDVAGTVRIWRQVLQQRVANLQELDQWGKDTPRVKVEVELFERALDRSAKVMELVARLNLDERRVRLDERVAGQLVDCLTKILDDLEITPQQRERAAQVVPARMRELTA